MLDFPIVDTHLHLWDPARLRYTWLDGEPRLNRPFLPADYRAACGPVVVDKMVFVQCDCAPHQNHKEVDFITHLAEEEPRLEGIVCGAPMEQGASLYPDLALLAENPLVKGVRRLLQSEPDPAFCLQPDFIAGVRLLPDYGLHFEICIRHTQLANVLTFVKRCPEVRFILDHIAKPDIREHNFHPWKENLTALAQFPNVWCKISGVATEADPQNWTLDDVRPYIEHVIESFGFDRVLYGSDWPVAILATEYPRWVETLETVVQGCTAGEKRKLFRDNALSFYRLS